MTEHNPLGEAGEDATVQYPEQHEHTVRYRNWHKGHLELDIVAAQNGELIVVEAKTRIDTDSALPQDIVTPRKIRRTAIVTDIYTELFQIDVSVRFDIITVIGKVGNFRIEHVKEAFYPPLF